MSETMRQESPLIERNTVERRRASAADAGVTVRERRFLAYVNVRGKADDAGFADAIRELTGIELPLTPNTVADGNGVRALWLGPDEWYLVGEAGTEAELVGSLEQALAGRHVAINDLSSGLTTIVVGGPHARDVLEKGCTLDLHPRAFAEGQCAQTMIAHAGVVIRYVDEVPTFELTVRRSFADYLWVWLEDAALEFGMAVAE